MVIMSEKHPLMAYDSHFVFMQCCFNENPGETKGWAIKRKHPFKIFHLCRASQPVVELPGMNSSAPWAPSSRSTGSSVGGAQWDEEASWMEGNQLMGHESPEGIRNTTASHLAGSTNFLLAAQAS